MDNLLEKALHQIEQRGWQDFELIQLVDETTPASNVYAQFPSRFCVLEAFGRHLDQSLLESMESFDDSETQKDRLFSLLMTRIDVLTPYKKVISILWRDVWKDPFVMISSIPLGMNSMSWILQSAGVDTTSFTGAIRIKAFALCYLAVVRVWLQDDSPDLDTTMQAVDANLDHLSLIPQFYT